MRKWTGRTVPWVYLYDQQTIWFLRLWTTKTCYFTLAVFTQEIKPDTVLAIHAD